jgi:hypothetical protein
MPPKQVLIPLAMICLGLLDWLTTVAGISFFGANEINPLFSALTSSSLLLFSTLKLTIVAIMGLAFYKATTISMSIKNNACLAPRIFKIGYLFTFFVLATVVISNLITIIRV